MEDNYEKINVVIMGVSYLETMASSMRIRNLIDPFENNSTITFRNLIFASPEVYYQKGVKGYHNHVYYKFIGYELYNIFSLIAFGWKGCRFLRQNKIKDSKNILYNYGYPNIENILFILFAKIKGYKIIFDIVEDNSFVDDFKSFKGKIKNKTSLFLFRNLAWYANGCIAISNYLFGLCKKISKNKFPVFLIPISVNFKYFPKTFTNKRSNKLLKIFYSGSFGKKDGIDFLVKSFSIVAEKYDNIKLILTGIGAERHLKNLYALIDKSPFKNRIEYLGYLPTEEYYCVLNDCDIFCVTRINSPYANAGFPFKLGEYLAAGKIVIATSIGDVPHYLTHKVNALLVEPENVNSLANAIFFCIQNPVKCLEIGNNGKKVAKEQFDAIAVSRKLLKIYNLL